MTMKKILTILFLLPLIAKSQFQPIQIETTSKWAENGPMQFGYLIQTNIPVQTQDDNVITIYMDGYVNDKYYGGTGRNMGIKLGWYFKASTGGIENISASSYGGFAPNIMLGQENGLINIYLDIEGLVLSFPRIKISAFAGGSNEDPSWFDGWQVRDDRPGNIIFNDIKYYNEFSGLVKAKDIIANDIRTDYIRSISGDFTNDLSTNTLYAIYGNIPTLESTNSYTWNATVSNNLTVGRNVNGGQYYSHIPTTNFGGAYTATGSNHFTENAYFDYYSNSWKPYVSTSGKKAVVLKTDANFGGNALNLSIDNNVNNNPNQLVLKDLLTISNAGNATFKNGIGNGSFFINPEGANISLSSGDDIHSIIDFKGNGNLGTIFQGRILHTDAYGFRFYTNGDFTNANLTLENNGNATLTGKPTTAGGDAGYIFFNAQNANMELGSADDENVYLDFKGNSPGNNNLGTDFKGRLQHGDNTGFQFFTGYDNVPGSTSSKPKMVIQSTNGFVGINTSSPQSMLAVNGDITARKLKVTKIGWPWPDYVFEPSYDLRSLKGVEEFIVKYKHLPDVPSASDIEKGGLDVGDTQGILLRKIEELTLYVIKQQKEMEMQNKKIEELEKKVEKVIEK